MREILFSLLIAILSYLLGCFSTGITISRAQGVDIRSKGSKNTGASNVLRVLGLKSGLVTFVGDFLKAALAVLIGHLLLPGETFGVMDFGKMLGGLFAVLGHNWPVFYGFKGGKGVACFFAFMFFSFPLGGAITFGFALVVFFLCHKISLVSMTSSLLFTILCAVNHAQRPWLWLFALACTAVIIIRHKDNIKRLIAGTEGTINY